MKRFGVLAISLVLLSLFFLTAFTSNRDFSIDVGDSYIKCYNDESKKDIAKKLDMTEKEVVDFFEQNNVRFLGVSNNNTSQVRVSVYEDEFSKKTADMSNLSNSEIRSLSKELLKNQNIDYDIYVRNSVKYIKISEVLKDSGGEYTATQYLTVLDEKLYNITFYNANEETSADNQKILDTFKVNEETGNYKYSAYISILIAFAIAGLTAIIVVMVMGIIKNKNDEEYDK